MGEIELALAASARPWVDGLHRFLADHGGARVRTVVMGPEDVITQSFDVLVIDDVCSFLTPRLVEQVRRRGCLVVGVFDARDGTDAKRRLLDCGVDDVVEAEASPDEFLAVVGRVHQFAPDPVLDDDREHRPGRRGRVIVVGAPQGGCGATEVVIALGDVLTGVMVDGDDVAPALAQRMGAPLHPNLRTAIDVVHHRSGAIGEAMTPLGRSYLVAGLAHGDDWAQLHAGEVEGVVDELAAVHTNVVVNVGAGLERPQLGEGRFGLARSLVAQADVVVAVGLPHPVGVTRLVRWVNEATVLAPDTPVVVVVNRAGRSRYRRGEVEAELARALPGVQIRFLPEDPRVAEAAWAGSPVKGGPFLRSVRRLARDLTR